jgi:hypothetical protein
MIHTHYLVFAQLSERDVVHLIPLVDEHSQVHTLQMVTSTFRNLSAADERFGVSLAMYGLVPKLLSLLNR